MSRVWLHYNQMNAELFEQDYDFVITHDPQPPLDYLKVLNRLAGQLEDVEGLAYRPG